MIEIILITQNGLLLDKSALKQKEFFRKYSLASQ